MKYRNLKYYKYQLTERLISQLPAEAGGVKRPELASPIITKYIHLHPSGELIQAEHYAWDGPSGPPKWWAAILFGKWRKAFLDKCLEPSCKHDAGYQLMKEGYLDPAIWKDYIDRVLELDLIAKKMSKWWAARWYWAVKDFGGRSWIKNWKPKSS